MVVKCGEKLVKSNIYGENLTGTAFIQRRESTKDMGKNPNENMVQQSIHIAKAIGWYIDTVNKISNHKQYTQTTLAKQMNLSNSALSRKIIKKKEAGKIIDENSFKQEGKRKLEIDDAQKLCAYLDTTLTDVLFFYERKEFWESNLSLFDKMNNLTKNLTNSSDASIPFGDEFLQKSISLSSQSTKNSNFISDVTHPDFEPWFGKFYCYFSSTSSEEAGHERPKGFNRYNDDPELDEMLKITPDDYIFCGILDIQNGVTSNTPYCHVEFKFLSDPNKLHIKRYHGRLTISRIRNVVFIELLNNEEGELSYLIVEKKEIGSTNPYIQCSMAMALTISSHEGHRRPCCERMILCRNPIDINSEAYKTIKANLHMNDNNIRITDWGYNELIREIQSSNDPLLKEIARKYPNLKSLKSEVVKIEECAFIPETYIDELSNLTVDKRKKFETMLRLHSIAPWYSKTKSIKINDLINYKQDSD